MRFAATLGVVVQGVRVGGLMPPDPSRADLQREAEAADEELPVAWLACQSATERVTQAENAAPGRPGCLAGRARAGVAQGGGGECAGPCRREHADGSTAGARTTWHCRATSKRNGTMLRHASACPCPNDHKETPMPDDPLPDKSH